MPNNNYMDRKPMAMSSLALAVSLAASGAMAEETEDNGDTASLDPVVVTGSDRSETPISETTRSVTVIDREDIEKQASIDRNLSSILAQTVPGISPSTESISNFGQKLRGRNILVLIDGIPQSTPIRNGQRGLNTISPAAIERIEVVRGGTAAYGFGATGGLINIITKEASDERLSGYSEAGYRFDASDIEESDDVQVDQRISGTVKEFDYVLSGSYVERGGRFDGDGDRIPPDPLGNQGGFADTDEVSLLGKGGLDFDGGRQRIEVMLSHFDNEQDSDFVTTQEIKDGKTVAVPKDEAPKPFLPVKDPGTENTAGRVTYRNADLMGSSVRVNAYGLDQEVIFTGFQDSSTTNQQQIGNKVEKYGARTTVETPIGKVFLDGSKVTWGFDYLESESEREGFGEGGINVLSPDLDQEAAAGFAQLEVPTGDVGILRAGVRYEDVEVDVGSLDEGTSTIPTGMGGNFPVFEVKEASLDFDEYLFNAGAVFYATERIDLVASFSQGFSLANLSRGLNRARFRNDPVEPKELESEVQTVDNTEVGLRYFGSRLTASSFVFFSESENTPVFEGVPLEQVKRDSEVYGIEGQLDYTVDGDNRIGGTFSWAEGFQEQDDGSDERLQGTQISPAKVTGYWETDIQPWWQNRLQVTYVGNRNEFPDAAGPGTRADFGKGRVDDYTVVDLTSSIELGPGELGFSVRNLFDNDYKPAINQAANAPSLFANASGRRFGVSYSMEW